MLTLACDTSNSTCCAGLYRDGQELAYKLSMDTRTHFGCEPREWDTIDQLQIELTRENTDLVLGVLRKIHVPGEVSDEVVTVYGYRTDVDYLT